jgi:phosphoribosylanthranilate isomerase
MRTRLKVCCIASRDEARLAIELGAAAVGLVSAMPSGAGVISDPLIAEIAPSVPPPVARFLLTSRTDGEAIAAQALACHVDTVQLVDSVPPDAYVAIRRLAPHLRIVQVLHVEDEAVLAEAAGLEGQVDALLLDSGRPNATVRELGGTGRVHDWTLSRRIVAGVALPVFLAGGIRPENVAAAIAQVRPYGIDLCTGVRTDGRLDREKLSALVAAIEAADRAAYERTEGQS